MALRSVRPYQRHRDYYLRVIISQGWDFPRSPRRCNDSSAGVEKATYRHVPTPPWESSPTGEMGLLHRQSDDRSAIRDINIHNTKWPISRIQAAGTAEGQERKD